MRRILAVLFVALFLFGAQPAAGDDLTLPIPEVTRGEPGSVGQIAAVAVPVDLQGQTCDVNLLGVNNGSVHPGNDLVIGNGDQVFEFTEVEAVADAVVARSKPGVILADTVTVSLRYGANGVSSTGFELLFDCTPPPTTTTTTTPPSTTTSVPTPPSTLPPTPPESNPPVTVPDYTG
jgi:hypothetical protein